jgi:hypothetical protein
MLTTLTTTGSSSFAPGTGRISGGGEAAIIVVVVALGVGIAGIVYYRRRARKLRPSMLVNTSGRHLAETTQHQPPLALQKADSYRSASGVRETRNIGKHWQGAWTKGENLKVCDHYTYYYACNLPLVVAFAMVHGSYARSYWRTFNCACLVKLWFIQLGLRYYMALQWRSHSRRTPFAMTPSALLALLQRQRVDTNA